SPCSRRGAKWSDADPCSLEPSRRTPPKQRRVCATQHTHTETTHTQRERQRKSAVDRHLGRLAPALAPVQVPLAGHERCGIAHSQGGCLGGGRHTVRCSAEKRRAATRCDATRPGTCSPTRLRRNPPHHASDGKARPCERLPLLRCQVRCILACPSSSGGW